MSCNIANILTIIRIRLLLGKMASRLLGEILFRGSCEGQNFSGRKDDTKKMDSQV
jgi:hypothetical protein